VKGKAKHEKNEVGIVDPCTCHRVDIVPVIHINKQ